MGRKESADLKHSLVPQRRHAGAFGQSHSGTVRGDGEERVGRTDGLVSHLGLGILSLGETWEMSEMSDLGRNVVLMIFLGGGCSGFRNWGISNMIICHMVSIIL